MTHEAHTVKSRVQLMIWDTDPRTYNLPDRQTNVNSKDELNVGDRIIAINALEIVHLTINKIISVKDSSLSGYKYYELLTTRSHEIR